MSAPVAAARAVIYLRGSDEESDTSHQLFVCREFCNREGMTVLAVYDEGGGLKGGDIHRKQFDMMLRRIAEERDVDVLVIYKTDRALRRTKELLELKAFCDRNGVRLVGATQPIDTRTPEGKAFFVSMGAWSELELDFASVRIRDAYKHLLAEHGTRPSVSWRGALKPLVSQKWGRPPGARDKKPRVRRWFRKPPEAASPLETISVMDLQADMKRLEGEIAAEEARWVAMPPSPERDAVFAGIGDKRRQREARADVISAMMRNRSARPAMRSGGGA